MPRLHYVKGHILDQLHDELRAAGIAPLAVEGLNADVWITVADDVDPAAVAAVVAAHDGTPKPRPDPLAEAAEQLKALAPSETALSPAFKAQLGALVDALVAERTAT